jgi:parvulin-like peptidyl-prolyl isomerase
MSREALRRTPAALAVLVLVQGGVAFGAGDDVAVRVGDWSMTAPQITAEFTYSPPALINQVKRSDNAARLVAVEWYSNALIAKAAADDKLLDKLPGLKDAADAFRRKMIAVQVLPEYLKEKYAPDERELRQFVDMNEAVCQAPARYHVARIGVVVGKKASEAEAQGAKGRIEDIKKRLAAGESFATLADEKSDLPAKGPGGEVGWLSDKEVEHTDGKEKLTSLHQGDVSEVAQTGEGYVIFKLLDFEAPRKLSFEECRPTAEKVMNERYRAQIARDWVDELAKRYNASINMDAFAAAVRAVPLDKDWLDKQATNPGGEPAEP